MTKIKSDRLIDVTVLPDYEFDDVANSVWVNYITDGVPHKTNTPEWVFDDKTRQKVILLLQAAIEKLKGE